ncbi:MAG TPA: hypothetical protein VL027_00740 [Spongiibacteraceae bacterium]|jgi:hypothetical protein|nr:hypothetical protein [Spongiibacteraceae bacterium]
MLQIIAGIRQAKSRILAGHGSAARAVGAALFIHVPAAMPRCAQNPARISGGAGL